MRKSKQSLINATMNKLIKEGRVTTVPMFDYNGAYEESQKRNAEAKKELERIEQERIDHIRCPSCQSNNKKHVVKRDSNGVCGPGYASWITDEYFVCKECGTRYEDLAKMTDNDE